MPWNFDALSIRYRPNGSWFATQSFLTSFFLCLKIGYQNKLPCFLLILPFEFGYFLNGPFQNISDISIREHCHQFLDRHAKVTPQPLTQPFTGVRTEKSLNEGGTCCGCCAVFRTCFMGQNSRPGGWQIELCVFLVLTVLTPIIIGVPHLWPCPYPYVSWDIFPNSTKIRFCFLSLFYPDSCCDSIAL